MCNHFERVVCDLAVDNQRLLRDDLAQTIVALCDIVRQAPLSPAAKKWIINALKEATRPKSARSDSSPSDHSSDHARNRRRGDPSAYWNASISTPFAVTSGSDSSRPPLQRPLRQKDHRQALRRINHASEGDDSDSPPFPPRIARHRDRVPSPPTPSESARLSHTRRASPSRLLPSQSSPLLATTCPPLASIRDTLTSIVMLST